MAFKLFSKKSGKESKGLYLDLIVRKIVRETEDAISIVFQNPPASRISYRPGQFLTLILSINGKEERRSYSICTSPFVDEDVAVTVKRVKGGLVSNWLPDTLSEGNTAKVMKPMGSFTTEFLPGNERHLVMFAGGSGITPVMSMLKSVLVQEPGSKVSLIYGNRNIESIIFKQELDQLAIKFKGRLTIVHVLENPSPDWRGYTGLLTKDLIDSMLGGLGDLSPDKTTYWLCGPEVMMKIIEEALSARNVLPENVRKELFVHATVEKESAEVLLTEKPGVEQSRVVTILYEGEEYKVTVEPGKFILETALDEGIDLPFSCQSGICTSCRGRKLSGEMRLVNQEGLSQAELDEGYVLTCIGQPLSDDLVIEIG